MDCKDEGEDELRRRRGRTNLDDLRAPEMPFQLSACRLAMRAQVDDSCWRQQRQQQKQQQRRGRRRQCRFVSKNEMLFKSANYSLVLLLFLLLAGALLHQAAGQYEFAASKAKARPLTPTSSFANPSYNWWESSSSSSGVANNLAGQDYVVEQRAMQGDGDEADDEGEGEGVVNSFNVATAADRGKQARKLSKSSASSRKFATWQQDKRAQSAAYTTRAPTTAPAPQQLDESSQRAAGGRARSNRAAPSSRLRSVAAQAASARQSRLAQSGRQLGRQQGAQVAPNNSATGSGNKCALILQRTYVKKITTDNSNSAEAPATTASLLNVGELSNELGAANSLQAVGAQLQPTGKEERVCITFNDVNRAISEAKRTRQFDSVGQEELESIEPSVPTIAKLGELNQEVTRLLAQKFDLSADEILNGLPLIDMSRTDFWPLCPLMVRPVLCDASGRFRSFTGHCNNLKNPAWGAAQTPFVRYLAPMHPDGIQAERASVVDGSPLPSPRLVTSMVHRDADQPSSDLSLMIMVWGQIIDHDVALAAPPRGKQLALASRALLTHS